MFSSINLVGISKSVPFSLCELPGSLIYFYVPRRPRLSLTRSLAHKVTRLAIGSTTEFPSNLISRQRRFEVIAAFKATTATLIGPRRLRRKMLPLSFLLLGIFLSSGCCQESATERPAIHFCKFTGDLIKVGSHAHPGDDI